VSSDDPFDIEKLRVDPADPKLVPATSGRKTSTFMARGKRARAFPPKTSTYTAFLESWVDCLKANRYSTVAMYRLALAIQRAATLQNTLTPKLPNSALGVHRNTKYKLLSRLTKLGMLEVIAAGRGRGCATVVRILEPGRGAS
jgi:hypothetical protein